MTTVTSDGAKVVVGSAWTVAMRWAIRLIGLVSTIVLARLLNPSDFGLVAMAMVVVGLVEVFGETGQRLALIRHPRLERVHLDTAWTLSVCQGICLAAVMWGIAPVGAWYFGEPRSTALIRVLSVRALVGGFENIGIIAFRKDMEFGKDFRFNVYQKLLTFFLTMAAAIAFRNYWALVFGIVTGRCVSTLLSYRMHPYRPMLSFGAIGELWAYSNWMLVVHLGEYLQAKVDQVAVGRVSGGTSMGYYSAASDLGTMPTLEVVEPMARALFPGYALKGGDQDGLRQMYQTALGVVATICLATGPGIALVSKDLVIVVLGSKWTSAGPLVGYLALAGALTGVTGAALTVLTVSGKASAAGAVAWARLILLVPVVLLGAHVGGIEGVACGRLAVMSVVLPCVLTIAAKSVRGKALSWLRVLWRPALGALLMCAVVMGVGYSLSEWNPMQRLFAKVIVGALTYASAVFVLWNQAGRPDGAESTIVHGLRSFGSRRQVEAQ